MPGVNRAELTVRTLEKAWARNQAQQKQVEVLNNLKRSYDCYARGYLLVDTAHRKWKLLHLNGAAVTDLGEQLLHDFLPSISVILPVSSLSIHSLLPIRVYRPWSQNTAWKARQRL